MENRERRTFEIPELRIADEGDGPRVTGYAAVFDQWSENLGGFREKIEPGAFAGAVGGDVRALWNHNADYVLGRTASGTLRLSEDDHGLAFEVEPPDAQWARDALATMRRGDVNQMSFGFETVRDHWEQGEDGEAKRTLLEVRLHDVSPVTFPAYPQTNAQVRARVEELNAALIQEDDDANASDDKTQARLDIMRRRLELADNKYTMGVLK